MSDWNLVANFHIPFEPIPWKAKVAGRFSTYSPNYKAKEMMKEYLTGLKLSYDCETFKPLAKDVMVRLDFTFYFLPPKSASKKKLAQMLSGDLQPMSGGDLTNLKKFIEDCMTGIVYEDDRQVVSHGPSDKFYSMDTAILVRVYRR